MFYLFIFNFGLFTCFCRLIQSNVSSLTLVDLLVNIVAVDCVDILLHNFVTSRLGHSRCDVAQVMNYTRLNKYYSEYLVDS